MVSRKFNVNKGQKFDLLTVIDEFYLTRKNYKQRYVRCMCECGKYTTLRVTSLFINKINSCGCIKAKNMGIRTFKHGMCKTPLYYVFTCMKNRCYRKELPDYKNYGARGIVICDEWMNDFMSFYTWAINNGYQKGLTIERKDNNKGYIPDNCCFVTRQIQCNNKRDNHIVEYKGDRLTMMEFCRKHNLSYSLFEYRIRSKKPIEKAMINCGTYKHRDQTKSVKLI